MHKVASTLRDHDLAVARIAPLTRGSEFRLQTFGRLALFDRDGNEDPSLITRPRKLAVLAWLALRPQQRATRDKIVGVFWGERDAERARNSLSDALSHLRRVLGRDALQNLADEVMIATDSHLMVDALELTAAAAAGEHARVVALYAGPFLDGVYVNDAPEFADWADRERTRLSGLFARSAQVRCRELMQGGACRECRQLAERWLDADPASASAAIQLLNATNAAQSHESRVAALAAYDAIVRRLDKDVGAHPHNTVTALAREIAEQLAAEPKPLVTNVEPFAASTAVSISAVMTKSIQEAPPVLQAEGVTHSIEAIRSARPNARVRRSRINYLTGAALVISALGLASFQKRDTSNIARRVVVVPFENRTGDSTLAPYANIAADWIGRGLTDFRIADVVDAVRPSSQRSSSARAIGTASGAGIVVTGAYFAKGDSVGFESRLIDSRDGRVLRAMAPSMAMRGNALAAVNDLRQRVAGELAAELNVVLAGLVREASQPPNYDAYHAYVEGVELFAHREFAVAAPAFMRAAALDTNFAAARLWGLASYGNSGDLARADSLTRSLNASRTHLTAFERGMLDLWIAQLSGNAPARYTAARAMLAAAPASQLAMYLSGLAASGINHPEEAIAVLRQMPAHGVGTVWDSYGTGLAAALHDAGHFDEELNEAHSRRMQEPGLLAAIDDEARALVALGRLEEVDHMMSAVVSLPSQPAHSAGITMYVTAQELRVHGHEREAKLLFQRALTWARDRPVSETRTGRLPELVARSLHESGDYVAANSLLRDFAGQNPQNGAALGWVGVNAAQRGDVLEANRISQKLAKLETPYLRGTHTLWRARIAAVLGQKEEAVRLIRQSISEGVSIRSAHVFGELLSLRGYAPFDDLVRPAG